MAGYDPWVPSADGGWERDPQGDHSVPVVEYGQHVDLQPFDHDVLGRPLHALHEGLFPYHQQVSYDQPATFSYPDEPPCNACGGGHPDGDWACPKLDPTPQGGRGDWHRCANPSDPDCQGQCGGGGW